MRNGNSCYLGRWNLGTIRIYYRKGIALSHLMELLEITKVGAKVKSD